MNSIYLSRRYLIIFNIYILDDLFPARYSTFIVIDSVSTTINFQYDPSMYDCCVHNL